MLNEKLPIAILTDSYKAGHFSQYPDANKMVAYGEFRKPYAGMSDERIVFYGIRYIVENYLNKRWTKEDVEEAAIFYQTHNVLATEYPFPKDLFMSFVEDNDGYFPVPKQRADKQSHPYLRESDPAQGAHPEEDNPKHEIHQPVFELPPPGHAGEVIQIIDVVH